jgi:hypothetical protein
MGFFVPEERLELSRINPTASETATFTNFAIRANVSKTVMCPRQDSNLHNLSVTTPSRWHVYQFHHMGNAGVKDTAFFFFAKTKDKLICIEAVIRKIKPKT